MRHVNGQLICGRRQSDRARRSIVVGTLAAVAPVGATAGALRLGWEMPEVVLSAMVTSVVAGIVVGALLVRLTTRLAEQASTFDEERRRWRNEAYTDPLCGVPNRRGAAHLVEEAQRAAGLDDRWTVVALDVDRFKEVNDRNGHAVGDRVLASVARTIADRLPVGAAVARWGGDEFVVFVAGPDGLPDGWVEATARAVAEHPIACREGDLFVTISHGVAQGPAIGSFDDVLARADDALMAAKAATRSTVGLLRRGADATTSVVLFPEPGAAGRRAGGRRGGVIAS